MPRWSPFRRSWHSLFSDFTAEDTEIIRLLQGLCGVSVGIFGSIFARSTLMRLHVLVREGDRSFVLLCLLTMKEKNDHITSRKL